MKYLSTPIAIMSMFMNLNTAFSSDDFISYLNEPDKSNRIAEAIFEKIGPDANIRDLTEEEKEWLYETRLLKEVKDIQKQGGGEEQDLSRKLGELALLYAYKGREDLTDAMLRQKADLDLRSALIGDGATLGIFKSMIQNNNLEDRFFHTIIDYYLKDPDAFEEGKYSYLVKDASFQEHVLSLSQAYKKSFPETFKIRKQANEPAILVSDQSLRLDLLQRIKKEITNRYNNRSIKKN
ncbi:hypothetical protein [Candidatus Odyssella thessalonicensis]|uniref:hypothetical protein n=1 Tax=Candidatus Odyssella thessalonicensis TaxID=84647 RepID=UPI000225BF8D|nr:hypothetical protein [Candidatus Odyssella thessalonicensis]